MRVPPRFARLLALWFFAVGAVRAQQTPAGSAAIEGVKGLRQEGAGSVKNPPPPAAEKAAAIVNAQGVQKVEGLDKVEGVKPPPQNAVTPPPPPPPPPP